MRTIDFSHDSILFAAIREACISCIAEVEAEELRAAEIPDDQADVDKLVGDAIDFFLGNNNEKEG